MIAPTAHGDHCVTPERSDLPLSEPTTSNILRRVTGGLLPDAQLPVLVAAPGVELAFVGETERVAAACADGYRDAQRRGERWDGVESEGDEVGRADTELVKRVVAPREDAELSVREGERKNGDRLVTVGMIEVAADVGGKGVEERVLSNLLGLKRRERGRTRDAARLFSHLPAENRGLQIERRGTMQFQLARLALRRCLRLVEQRDAATDRLLQLDHPRDALLVGAEAELVLYVSTRSFSHETVCLDGDDGFASRAQQRVGEVDHVQREVLVSLQLAYRVSVDEQTRSDQCEIARSPVVLALLLRGPLFESTRQGNAAGIHCEIPVGDVHGVGVNELYRVNALERRKPFIVLTIRLQTLALEA